LIGGKTCAILACLSFSIYFTTHRNRNQHVCKSNYVICFDIIIRKRGIDVCIFRFFFKFLRFLFYFGAIAYYFLLSFLLYFFYEYLFLLGRSIPFRITSSEKIKETRRLLATDALITEVYLHANCRRPPLPAATAQCVM